VVDPPCPATIPSRTLVAAVRAEARTGNDDNTTQREAPRQRAGLRNRGTLRGDIHLCQQPPQPRRNHNSRTTPAQQNHTSQTQLIQTTRTMRLGRPPVSGQMSGQRGYIPIDQYVRTYLPVDMYGQHAGVLVIRVETHSHTTGGHAGSGTARGTRAAC
jgi:hypothetical protein